MPISSSSRWKVTTSKYGFWLLISIGVCIFAIGLILGWQLTIRVFDKPVTIIPIHDPDSGYSFINPTLFTESPQELSFPTYSPLKNALTQYTDAAISTNKATQIGIYFRDLNSNDWIGINQDQQFDAASMMKVATLIAVLRLSETQPEILSAKVTMPSAYASLNKEDYFPASDPVVAGKSYPIPELVQQLITQSDNGADAALVAYVGDQGMATIYNDLHLPIPGTTTGISPEVYSHLFRVLYNATYLNSPDSEEALSDLSRTTFTAGLVAGVPSGTVVAHKFGESMDDTPGLNDCGIIYDSTHPYFLCVMTKGSDFNTLAGVIKDISNITWKQVNAIKSLS